MPSVTLPDSPSGLPTASTTSPARAWLESPNRAGCQAGRVVGPDHRQVVGGIGADEPGGARLRLPGHLHLEVWRVPGHVRVGDDVAPAVKDNPGAEPAGGADEHHRRQYLADHRGVAAESLVTAAGAAACRLWTGPAAEAAAPTATPPPPTTAAMAVAAHARRARADNLISWAPLLARASPATGWQHQATRSLCSRRAAAGGDGVERGRPARGGGGRSGAGRVSVIWVPCPGSLLAPAWPPCARASSAATDRPMPLPETCCRLLAAPEPVEDVGQLVGGDADAGVGDLEHGVAAGQPGAHGDPAAGRGELQRVGEQVGDDLVQPGPGRPGPRPGPAAVPG